MIARLEQIGFIKKHKARWKVKAINVHAPQVAAAAADTLHQNWQVKVLGISGADAGSGVQYGAVHALNSADMVQVREILHNAIRETRGVIEPSPEEMEAFLVVGYVRI